MKCPFRKETNYKVIDWRNYDSVCGANKTAKSESFMNCMGGGDCMAFENDKCNLCKSSKI